MIARKGDRFDTICFRAYGSVDGPMVAALMSVNPGKLRDFVFDAGDDINTPEFLPSLSFGTAALAEPTVDVDGNIA